MQEQPAPHLDQKPSLQCFLPLVLKAFFQFGVKKGVICACKVAPLPLGTLAYKSTPQSKSKAEALILVRCNIAPFQFVAPVA